jgi:hypothetical protein
VLQYPIDRLLDALVGGNLDCLRLRYPGRDPGLAVVLAVTNEPAPGQVERVLDRRLNDKPGAGFAANTPMTVVRAGVDPENRQVLQVVMAL